jgi:hypothetical protein
MNLVDTSGWLEYFFDGPNASYFSAPIEIIKKNGNWGICDPKWGILSQKPGKFIILPVTGYYYSQIKNFYFPGRKITPHASKIYSRVDKLTSRMVKICPWLCKICLRARDFQPGS